MKNLLFIFVILFISCEKGSVKGDFLLVYKTKQDYSRNIWVQLSEDKSTITAFPGVSDVANPKYLPTKLINDYFLNGNVFINLGITSLTVDTYKTYVGPDSLYKLIIDKDPFIELWDCKKRKKHLFFNDNGIDVAKINEVISEGKLDKYFDKIK